MEAPLPFQNDSKPSLNPSFNSCLNAQINETTRIETPKRNRDSPTIPLLQIHPRRSFISFIPSWSTKKHVGLNNIKRLTFLQNRFA